MGDGGRSAMPRSAFNWTGHPPSFFLSSADYLEPRPVYFFEDNGLKVKQVSGKLK